MTEGRLLQRMLEAINPDNVPWYKRKFRSAPKLTFNPKYPQRHQGARECARRQRQKDRAAAKEASNATI